MLTDDNLSVKKDGNWKSEQKWNFKTECQKCSTISIEKATNNMVLVNEDNDVVQEEPRKKDSDRDKISNHMRQIWKMGKPDKKGFFTLKNCYSKKLLTFVDKTGLTVKGKSFLVISFLNSSEKSISKLFQAFSLE